MVTMPNSRIGPSAQTVPALSEAPSSTIAISSSVLALTLMPGCQTGPGVQKVRTSTPSRIAITSASR